MQDVVFIIKRLLNVPFCLFFKVVDELVEGENRNVFRFTKEDSSSGAKRNINLISVEVLRPQAGSYDKRC